MSISTAIACLQAARNADSAAERLGQLATAQEALKAAIKAAKEASLEVAGGQDALPGLNVHR